MNTFPIVGFTGTQEGMTDHQLVGVMEFLVFSACREGHHGDCLGADAQFHRLCLALKSVRDFAIVIHPPENPRRRANCLNFTELLATKPYMARNHAIVAAANVLLATPKTEYEILRSGTWATIRYARRQGRAICIIRPDGGHVYENWQGVEL